MSDWTSRERLLALLAGEIPDRMGLFEHFWPETLNTEWTAQGLPAGTDPVIHFNYDMRIVGGWFESQPFPSQSEVVEETDEWQVVRDGRGAKLKYWKGKSGTPEHIGFEVDSPEVWARYREPLLAFDPARLGDLTGIAAALENTRAEGRAALYGNLFVFELLRGTLGDVNFLPALLEEPDWIDDFCTVYLNMYRRYYEHLFQTAGKPDAMFVYEDLGYSNGLFCSPATLAARIMPYERELVGFFHDHGIPVILHSCGDVRQAVPLIIEAGFDCIQPLEAKAGCDVVQMAQQYAGQICFMGNINVVQLETNDKQAVEDEVLGKVRWLRDHRVPYILHSDHSIPPRIRLDTYTYALQLFSENNRYA